MKIVLFGDSVTEGCFEIIKNNDEIVIVRDVPSVYGSLLENELKEKYPDKNIEVVNRGLSGRTSKEALNCFKELVLDEQPNLVIMCFGLNDICEGDIDSFKKAHTYMISALKNRGVDVIFMTPNTANYYVSKDEIEELIPTANDFARAQNDGTFDKFMDAIRTVVKEQKAYLVDAYAEWKRMHDSGIDTSLLLCNYINHPSRAMHHLFKDMLLECITNNNLIK